MIKDAHIVFLPYNYLTNREYRIMLNKYLDNSIIIFDEAHNVSGVAEDGYSITYTPTELQKTKDDFRELRLMLTQGRDVEQSFVERVDSEVNQINGLIQKFS